MRLGGISQTPAATAHRGVVKGNLVVVHRCLFWLSEEWGFGILRSQWPGARRRSACHFSDFCSNGKAA
jgi:hypothetical protein